MRCDVIAPLLTCDMQCLNSMTTARQCQVQVRTPQFLLDVQAPKQSRVVDATGKYVMPGGIDPHTHLDAEMGWGSKAEIISTDDFYRYFGKI